MAPSGEIRAAAAPGRGSARILNGALDIRHHVSGFDVLAYDLRLVSLNAQVASVRFGTAGDAFRVLTEETSRISEALARLVTQIRDLTRQWTALSARALGSERQVELLRRSALYQRAPQNATLIAADARLGSAIGASTAENTRFIRATSAIAEEMNKSLRLINYVTSGILVESTRLTNDPLEMETLQYLAKKMQSTADSIRGTAASIVGKLDELTRG